MATLGPLPIVLQLDGVVLAPDAGIRIAFLLQQLHRLYPATPLHLLVAPSRDPEAGEMAALVSRCKSIPITLGAEPPTGHVVAHALVSAEPGARRPVACTPSPLASMAGLLPVSLAADASGEIALPEGWHDALTIMDRMNAVIAAEGAPEAEQGTYAALDRLAVRLISEVRAARTRRFQISGVLCLGLAVLAWVLRMPTILLLLPVVVYFLLQVNDRVRRQDPYRIAAYVRSLAELLRIRNAVAEMGISTLEISDLYPRRDRKRFLPVVIGVIGMEAVQGVGKRDPESPNGAFREWVASQVDYYAATSERQARVAAKGRAGFDWAFSGLAIVAFIAILFSLIWPLLFPGSNFGLLGITASSLGALLSSLGLIAINFARETGAGPTASDYRHMATLFENIRRHDSEGAAIPENLVRDLVEEVLAEHASWYARTVGG